MTALFELEDRPRFRATYLEAMRVHGRLASTRDPLGPRELDVVVRASRTLRPPLVQVDRPAHRYVQSLARQVLDDHEAADVAALSAYWMGVRLEVIADEPERVDPPEQ